MSKHAFGLLIDSIANRWADTTVSSGTAAANATCAASISANVSSERIHMTQLGWSIRNNQAAGFTSTLNVSHASGTSVPTVIASWDITPATGSSLQDTWVIHMVGKKGKGIQAYFTAPAASVVQKVSMAGFRDTLSDG